MKFRAGEKASTPSCLWVLEVEELPSMEKLESLELGTSECI